MKKLAVICSIAIICSCSSLTSLRSYDGKTITLPAGMKLIKATLEKDSSMWLYMESVDSTYIPRTKILQKNSKYGITERKIVFKETK